MDRARRWLSRGVSVWIVGLALTGCGLPEEDCERACDRPFEILEDEAAVRSASWDRLPTPLGDEAAAMKQSWAATFAKERKQWQSTCVPECRQGTPQMLECRREAPNLAAWTACGEK